MAGLLAETHALTPPQTGSMCPEMEERREPRERDARLCHVFFEGVAVPVVRRDVREMVRRPRVEAPLPREQADFVAALFRQAGLPARAYRGAALARRLPACLRLLRVDSLEEAVRTLAARPALVPGVLSVVLLGVTEFFRDREVFAQVRLRVLPQLLQREARLRIWSAACSEGHELYSVAMLLAEAGRLDGSELVGSDCRSEAIEQARLGAFAGEALARLDPELRAKYFRSRATTSVIAPELRARSSWRVADLLERIEPGPWHLILWRNMAIYLEPDAAERLWTALCDELAPGGFLVAGKADYPPKSLPLRRVSPCLFQKMERRK